VSQNGDKLNLAKKVMLAVALAFALTPLFAVVTTMIAEVPGNRAIGSILVLISASTLVTGGTFLAVRESTNAKSVLAFLMIANLSLVSFLFVFYGQS
jgi:hypothetical protein